MSPADLPPLTELDPRDAWQPWQPDAANPWSLKWAAHLHRRAGFGAPPRTAGGTAWAWERLQRCVEQGFEATLAELLDESPGQADYDRLMDNLAPGETQRYEPGFEGGPVALQAWWLHRMVHTGSPLREKMTLFWHNHFATSIAKVGLVGLMAQQNQVLRRHALGRFQPLLLAVSKDPAMLLWLDSNTNVKDKPNENFARELMELFTLGVGNYTEQDIREAARAFSGWQCNVANRPGHIPPQPDSRMGAFFDAARHDGGEKVILGQKGKWKGEDVLRILLEQPVAARFLARKLYRQFISENATPPDALIEPLAVQLRQSDYDMGAVVKTMLRSRLFFSQHAYRQRIKSPVEYVVGLVHHLDVIEGPTAVAAAMDGLGQKLFAPPSVKGWDGGTGWLNSATLLSRHNLAWSAVTGDVSPDQQRLASLRGEAIEPLRANPAVLVQRHGGKEPDKQVGFIIDLLLQGDVAPAARGKLVEYLQQGGTSGAERLRRLKEIIHTVLVLPEYQLA